VQVSKRRRRHAHKALKVLRKMTLVSKASVQRDIHQGQLGVGQSTAGEFHTEPANELAHSAAVVQAE
jgi:hypothetical protein